MWDIKVGKGVEARGICGGGCTQTRLTSEDRKLLALMTTIYPKQKDDRRAYYGPSSANLGFKSVSASSESRSIAKSLGLLVVQIHKQYY